ncbi:MAG: hypothetical protein EOQ39_03555 [Mesorhizobium sp.]|uniref:HipA family kinase n=1 Tax=Mesorhizobium sp. TaxID=1871066 RepID=UPI000FE5010C|nr:HipA family kinase [Mesorhizobium sp.]RWB08986.1 MAG: hypothetical protein EOQ37_05710 [Mesorhizobium sp.]RWB17407.1 MAG: hypothetical protein EOQ39_03555 [Mesorhizobium sp.]
MLSLVKAVEFIMPMKNGRTGPALLLCERDDGSDVAVVTKFTSGCEQAGINLARETIGACLASDLSLPIPEAFRVTLSEEFIASVPNDLFQAKMEASSEFAFGSKHITGQYNLWNSGYSVVRNMLPVAASIFAFDGIIQNPDRRVANPNCLVKGDDVRIFDHELAFSNGLVIGWVAPWKPGGLHSLEDPAMHIFKAGLSGKNIDLTDVRSRWAALSDVNISTYGDAIPEQWNATDTIAAATRLIKEARDNIDGCVTELERVLG